MIVLKDLNLMPKNAIIKRESMRIIRTVLGVFVVVIIFSFLMDSGLILYKKTFQNKINAQKSQIESLVGAETERQALAIIKSKITFRQDILNKINSSNIKVMDFFNIIYPLVPGDVTISNLSLDNSGQVAIQGKGATEESVLDLYHSLKIKEIADTITFNSVKGTIGGKEGFDFAFTFKYKGGK